MLLPYQQKMIADLKATIAANERELSRVATLNPANEFLLQTLLDQIHALDIKLESKNEMAVICQSLLENTALAKRLNIELTETDVHFISILEIKHPNLDNRELRICLLVKLDYDNEEIARTASITTRGMESARYKLHQKLGLSKSDSIKNYLTNVCTFLFAPVTSRSSECFEHS
jgi:DNA-binding CsgD family transcriptional regulator